MCAILIWGMRIARGLRWGRARGEAAHCWGAVVAFRCCCRPGLDFEVASHLLQPSERIAVGG